MNARTTGLSLNLYSDSLFHLGLEPLLRWSNEEFVPKQLEVPRAPSPVAE
jgi:hypothetical protein